MDDPTYDYALLNLSHLAETLVYFDDVRAATHFRVVMPDGKLFFVTRRRLEDLAATPEAARIVFSPLRLPK